MADKKFSQFLNGNEMKVGDQAVGLRAGSNYRFDFPGDGVKDSTGNYLYRYTTAGAGAVNYLLFTNSISGLPVVLGAGGTDLNVGINIDTKAAGLIYFNASTGVDSIINDSTMGTATATNLSTSIAIKNYVLAQIGGAVTSVTGTADEILVNGTSGSAQVGALTLTLASPLITTKGGTGLTSYAQGDLLYYSAGTLLSKLTKDTNATRYLSNQGSSNNPSWNQINLANGVTGLLTGTNGGTGVNNGASTITLGGSLSTIGAFTAAFTITDNTAVIFPTSGTLATTASIPALPLSMANGGSGANLTGSAGGIVWTNSTSTMAVLAGTATPRQMLQSGSGATPAWSTATWPATTNINQLLYSVSANNVIGLTATARAVLSSNAVSSPTWTALTNGQIVIGSTAGNPAAGSINGLTGITVTGGSNTIDISTVGAGITWAPVAGTTQSVVVNTAYYTNNAGLTTINLPVSFAAGSVIKVCGVGAGGWVIQAATGDTIKCVNDTSSTGGTIASTSANDSIELLATVVNSTWTVISGSSGGYTLT